MECCLSEDVGNAVKRTVYKRFELVFSSDADWKSRLLDSRLSFGRKTNIVCFFFMFGL